jgi:hypothetical protein
VGVAVRAGHLLQTFGPVVLGRRELDLGEDPPDDEVEELGFVGDVVVDRHGLHPQYGPQAPHAERVHALLVDELNRSLEDAFLCKRRPLHPHLS